jgi:uncharacterized tellurite resistance protein B-like protein
MKKNKPVAGYHLLMILSAADGKFSAKEDLVIRKWLEEQFPFNVSLDNEMETLSALPHAEHLPHFKKCMADFYQDSNETERNELIQFALNLAKADKKITREENEYLDALFSEWTEIEI